MMRPVKRRGRGRMRDVQRQLVDILTTHPTRQISYDALSALVPYDRRTITTAVRQLETIGLVDIERGRGGVANRYRIPDDIGRRIDEL